VTMPKTLPASLDAGHWSPLGGGWLSGKYKGDEPPTRGTHIGDHPNIKALATKNGTHHSPRRLWIDARCPRMAQARVTARPGGRRRLPHPVPLINLDRRQASGTAAVIRSPNVEVWGKESAPAMGFLLSNWAREDWVQPRKGKGSLPRSRNRTKFNQECGSGHSHDTRRGYSQSAHPVAGASGRGARRTRGVTAVGQFHCLHPHRGNPADFKGNEHGPSTRSN
jgi:hypothetical protein